MANDNIFSPHMKLFILLGHTFRIVNIQTPDMPARIIKVVQRNPHINSLKVASERNVIRYVRR